MIEVQLLIAPECAALVARPDVTDPPYLNQANTLPCP